MAGRCPPLCAQVPARRREASRRLPGGCALADRCLPLCAQALARRGEAFRRLPGGCTLAGRCLPLCAQALARREEASRRSSGQPCSGPPPLSGFPAGWRAPSPGRPHCFSNAERPVTKVPKAPQACGAASQLSILPASGLPATSPTFPASADFRHLTVPADLSSGAVAVGLPDIGEEMLWSMSIVNGTGSLCRTLKSSRKEPARSMAATAVAADTGYCGRDGRLQRMIREHSFLRIWRRSLWKSFGGRRHVHCLGKAEKKGASVRDRIVLFAVLQDSP